MSEIDHEAAKELVQKSLRIGGITDLAEVTPDDIAHATLMADHPYTRIIKPISRAYLDLAEQLAAERARVQALCDVIHDANGVAYPFGDMQKKMDTILEGRDHA